MTHGVRGRPRRTETPTSPSDPSAPQTPPTRPAPRRRRVPARAEPPAQPTRETRPPPTARSATLAPDSVAIRARNAGRTTEPVRPQSYGDRISQIHGTREELERVSSDLTRG